MTQSLYHNFEGVLYVALLYYQKSCKIVNKLILTIRIQVNDEKSNRKFSFEISTIEFKNLNSKFF